MGYDVVALGELLVDFTPTAISNQRNQMFEANPGGAPCNVLSMLCKLGYRTAFIGKVGDDIFGHMLSKAIVECGIAIDGLRFDGQVNTTLAFVHKQENGDRDFSFYRNPGADMMLTDKEVSECLISQAKIFHFGSLSMTHPGVAAATRRGIEIAEANGVLRSFDPNLRPPLWNDLEEAKRMIHFGLAHCDILKISDNEIQWLTGEMDFSAGVKTLRSKFDIPLILVSMGPKGSRAYTEEFMTEQPARLTSETVDTTGAGDTFCACILHGVLQAGMNGLTQERLNHILHFANIAASIVTTRFGAIRAMPTRAQIEGLL